MNLLFWRNLQYFIHLARGFKGSFVAVNINFYIPKPKIYVFFIAVCRDLMCCDTM